MEKTGVTAHCLVRNEERFIWFALQSVLPHVDKALIWDTGSTDRTVAIIKTIKSQKILFEEKGEQSAEGLVLLRNEMIGKTRTPWFLLLDGDEVWSESQLRKVIDKGVAMPKEKIAVVCRTRNSVGDVYHYLPEEAGKYRLAGQHGHLSMRFFRNVPGLSVEGTYPLEAYTYNGQRLNRHGNRLLFVDAYYWHLTHLLRSSSPDKITGFRNIKIENGILAEKEEMPEVFWRERPSAVPSPLSHRGKVFEILAALVTPLKNLRRRKFRG